MELLLSKDNKNVEIMIQDTISEIEKKITQKLESTTKDIKEKIGEFKSEFEKLLIDGKVNDIADSEYLKSDLSNSNNKEMLVSAGAVAVNFIPPVVLVSSRGVLAPLAGAFSSVAISSNTLRSSASFSAIRAFKSTTLVSST